MASVDSQVDSVVDKPYFEGKDAFWLPDGSVYHLGTKPGQIAQRIIVVDLDGHARALVAHFDKLSFEIHSDRQMHTYTGTYRGVMVTVVAMGYGAPMMDFVMREAAMCCEGATAVVYLGVCGVLSLSPTAEEYTVCVASGGASYSFTNHAALADKIENSEKYNLTNSPFPFINTKPVFGDSELHACLYDRLSISAPVLNGKFCSVENLPAPLQPDDSLLVAHDVEGLVSRVGDANFVDCVTHQLFYLASRRSVTCKAASCCLGVPVGTLGLEAGYLSEHEQKHFSFVGGHCMEVLTKFKL